VPPHQAFRTSGSVRDVKSLEPAAALSCVSLRCVLVAKASTRRDQQRYLLLPSHCSSIIVLFCADGAAGTIPLTSDLHPAAARRSAIARLPNLARLNGSAVSVRERAEAEKLYVSAAAAQAQTQFGERPDAARGWAAAEHPRLVELAGKWGVRLPVSLDGTAREDAGAALPPSAFAVGTLRQQCVVTHIQYGDHAPLERTIPVAMSVGKLRSVFQRLLELDVAIRLTYSLPGGQSDELVGDSLYLSHFCPVDGWKIKVGGLRSGACSLSRLPLTRSPCR
jgi:hypothetical protein